MGRKSREERTQKIVNSNAIPEIIFDIVLIALGVVLIVWPVDAALMLTRIIGIVILVLAIVEIVVFAMSKSKEAMEYVLLVVSVLLAAVGIWLIVNPDWLVQFFNILFGVILGIYGLFGVFSSVGYGRKSGGLWWIGLILSIIAIAMAVFGGISSTGGKGNMAGGLISAFIIVCLRVGLGQRNVNAQVILLIIGVLLISAVALPNVIGSITRKFRKPAK